MVNRADDEAASAPTLITGVPESGTRAPRSSSGTDLTVLAGRYRLLRPIGTGGMGTVYEGEHLALGHRVAVKMLHPQYAQSETSTKRFMNEARAAARMRHPNVARCDDVGITPEGQPFLVLEFLEGRDLADEIGATGRLELGRALWIARQVASALGYAHAQGVVHRDLKPENVFLARGNDGREVVKVLDFGVARFIGLEHTSGTRTGAAIGTPLYMAPEQFTDASRVDARADVYGVGVVLYEMLTATRPFDASTLPELLARMNSGTFKPLLSVRSDVPRHVAQAVESALHADPAARPVGMEAFVAMLEGELPAPAPPSQNRHWLRSPRAFIALAILLITLSGVVGYALLHGSTALVPEAKVLPQTVPVPLPPENPPPPAARPEPQVVNEPAPAAEKPAPEAKEPAAEGKVTQPARGDSAKRTRRPKQAPRDRSIAEEPDF
jgi:serine/threonine-protein kinase